MTRMQITHGWNKSNRLQVLQMCANRRNVSKDFHNAIKNSNIRARDQEIALI
jgi:hypothetical protein